MTFFEIYRLGHYTKKIDQEKKKKCLVTFLKILTFEDFFLDFEFFSGQECKFELRHAPRKMYQGKKRKMKSDFCRNFEILGVFFS